MSEKNKYEQLETKEQKCIMKALYETLCTYPGRGSLNIEFEEFDKQGSGISLCSMQGAVYLQKDITGGFHGLVPFFIVYRSAPKTGRQKLNKIEFLEEMSEWLSSGENYPKISDGRVVERITPECVPFKDNADDAGNNDYIVTFNLTYRKDGE
ncbi:MAG: hypothetical protein NC293_10110 [Roseburia sp.]|nr:hypothetical protein [Roseburia sp.]